MKRVLFLRNYKVRRGGHITVRDYFEHSRMHPDLDPYIYFTPDSDADNDVWAGVSRDRFVTDLRVEDYDIVFVGGRLWRLLPDDLGDTKVVNVILHVRHATLPGYRRFLSRPAYRIANSRPVFDAVAPLVNGPLEVIHEGIDFDLFPSMIDKRPGSVLIYGQKNPRLADRLSAKLHREGVDVTSFNAGIPHAEFAHLMATTEIYVGLPHRTEGGYRPPLEAMSCRSAVVCADAVGTREYLLEGVTCLQPGFNDFRGHLDAIHGLLDDEHLREKIQTGGYEMAQQFSLKRQRELFHSFVERHLV